MQIENNAQLVGRPCATSSAQASRTRPSRIHRPSGRRTHRVTLLSIAAIGLLGLGWTSVASALYVDFADHQGAAVGQRADLLVAGHSITVSSLPGDFDLSITRLGLGVACSAQHADCSTNSASQIDAEWGEAITITFNDGPIRLNGAVLSSIYLGEVAVLGTPSSLMAAIGTSVTPGESTGWVDMGGVLTDRLVVTTFGWHSDVAVRGIDFDPGVSPVLGGPGPSDAVPEPSAALLFVVGLSVASVTRRGRVE